MVKVKSLYFNFLRDLKIVVGKISSFLIEKQHNYLQTFEENKVRFLFCLEKKTEFASLKIFVTL